jgi:hypothetical protein
MWRLGLLLCLFLVGCAPAGFSSAALPVSDLRVCAPAADAPCAKVAMYAIDPQHRLIRVRATVTAPAGVAESGVIYALHVGGQAAYAVYWNGRLIGSNGVPGATAAQEQPGLVEARIPIPTALLRPGANDLTLLVSSHHAGVRYMQPVGGFGITPWETVEPPLRTYAVALVALGVLGVGAAYFGALTWLRRGERSSLLLALASLAASGQLTAEVLRGFVTYAYPLHVWRVSAIAGFAALFGVLLTAFAASRFPQRHSRLAIAAAVVACGALLVLTPGFDSKAVACLVAGSGIGALLAWRGWRARQPGAAPAFAGLAAFPLLALLSGHLFLDQTFYVAVIGLALLLFAAQAVALTREERERTGAKLRAAELELQVLKRRLRQLVVHTRGAREVVDLGDVLMIRGADDYAELVLAGGATKLLSETLSSLAERLPDDFLRVHRSAIVNLACVSGAARKSGGGLEVTLTDGSAVAVGRSYTHALRAAIGL